MAEVVGPVNRARAFMPPGAVPPFIMRYDAGSVPVAQLVFSSESRSPGEMQDIALNRVRPIFATLPGVSAPPPFGGNQRTIVVRVDPERMRAYRLSPEEVIAKIPERRSPLRAHGDSFGLHPLMPHSALTSPSCWIPRCAWGRRQPSICGTSGPLRIARMSSWATPMWMASAPSIFLSPNEPTLPH